MILPQLAETFSKNRAEEFAPDVWNQFVIPLYFNKLDLLTAKKPRLIIGGRGCGKTMLLRYFSHQTQFSRERNNIAPEVASNIGLYWRVDTQFANAMRGRNIANETWEAAFNHFISLYVSLEIISALRSVEASDCSVLPAGYLGAIKLNAILGYDPEMPSDVSLLGIFLYKRLSELELWVSNTSKLPEPIFYPGVNFVLAFIRDATSNSALQSSVFHVFLDEFENLTENQQRIINTRVKHSKSPLIFSIAMKRRGFVTTRTVGTESIVEIADYRRHDLEEYLIASDFDTFAAEVLSLNLSFAGIQDPDGRADLLRDPNFLPSRNTPEYRQQVQSFAKKILPSYKNKELAQEIINSPKLLAKIQRSIKKSLVSRGSKIEPGCFYDEKYPQESIVVFALLARKASTPEIVLAEFNKLRNGESNSFPDWVHNNFVGCTLWLYDDEYRECPFYAGFHSYTLLAKGNLRHFLELVFKSFSIDTQIKDDLPIVPIDLQARAARQTSIAMLREVKGFGPEGNRLHTFVLRIGSLFALAHRRVTQSEPEITHFTIKRGSTVVSDLDEVLINEAIKWSVLFEVEETKVKESLQTYQANFEYVLNPIYAPYFTISYRKQRKLELTVDDFSTLANGAYDQVRRVLTRYSKKWSINLDDESPTLFSHLSDD